MTPLPVWIIFFVACTLQGIGFCLLLRRDTAANLTVLRAGAFLLAAGSLFMLVYALWVRHFVLLSGQALFSVYALFLVKRCLALRHGTAANQPNGQGTDRP